MLGTGPAPSLAERVGGIVRLDDAAYRAAAADPRATRQAVLVGVAAAVATGVGSIAPGNALGGFAAGAAQGLLWWLALTVAAAFVGNLAAGRGSERPAPEAVVRVLGLAQAPHLLMLLGAVPGIGLVASAAATIGGMLAAFTGIRVLWGRSPWWALGVGVAAFAVAFVVSETLTRPFT